MTVEFHVGKLNRSLLSSELMKHISHQHLEPDNAGVRWGQLLYAPMPIFNNLNHIYATFSVLQDNFTVFLYHTCPKSWMGAHLWGQWLAIRGKIYFLTPTDFYLFLPFVQHNK